MIYDCFMFLDEFEILDIRLRELENTVDRFVLVESAETHSGKPKRLFFDEKSSLFARWRDKICHVKVNKIPVDYPEKPVCYAREAAQRDCIGPALAGVRADDYVMVGDVDEIPRAEAVVKATKAVKEFGSVYFHQPLFYYYLNNFVSDVWNGTRMVGGDFFADPKNRPNMLKERWTGPQCVLKDAGWHFSWVGTPERLSYKLDSFMHQEWNNPKHNNLENFQKCLDTGADFWDRPGFPKPTLLALSALPACVRDNPSGYARLLKTVWQDTQESALQEAASGLN